MDKLQPYSPLQGLAGTTGINVKLKELNRFNLILRGKQDDNKFMKSARKIFDKLPVKPNSTYQKSGITIIWVSPDEWILTGDYNKLEKVKTDLDKSLENTHYALIDTSDYYMSANISGNNVRETLEKGVVVDLHDSAFPIGYATGTRYEKAVINLHREDNNSYNIIFRRSFAPYLWGHLVKASQEFK